MINQRKLVFKKTLLVILISNEKLRVWYIYLIFLIKKGQQMAACLLSRFTTYMTHGRHNSVTDLAQRAESVNRVLSFFLLQF